MKKDTAIAVYVDEDEYGVMELHWLYRSWVYSGSDTRSDLIVFYNPILDVDTMPKDNGVICIPLEPIKAHDNLWDDYPRVNSTYFLTTKEAEIVHKYKYTFRTDLDCFLTKNFVDFKPRLAHFGYNLYETEGGSGVSDRIGQFCKKHRIPRYHMNIDCNVMATSKAVTEYAKVQYEIATILRKEEFKDGHGVWPGWYEYVINMYSAGIAANKFFGLGCNVGGFDCMSMCSDPIGSDDYHIHAWHTYQHFSKVHWREGLYDVVDFNSLDDSRINQYCLKMAGRRFNV